ncbi:MAG: carboxypeptidase regulatory-like domain-containing protein [Planctomycetes bacterium]|nr:carboxypeptidase regulatory-like domain-containing protein [Planctomycetota bacterium]
MRTTALALLVSSALPFSPAGAQTFPAAGDPVGVVLDEHLDPIAGADVTLMWERDDQIPFARATADCLRQTPLPRTRSGRDGSFVLPLTPDHRMLGANGWRRSGCWLVVEKDGYRSWHEPIHDGLVTYLGSRVILRTTRADDPFVDVPWPPAWVTMKAETSMAVWLPVGAPLPELNRQGPAELLGGSRTIEASRIATLDLRVTGDGRPLARAAVLCDSAAYWQADQHLPQRVDDEGRLELNLPPGERTLRVLAPGYAQREVTVELEPGGRTRFEVELQAGRIVDVLAVTPAGVAVPFVRLDVIPKRGPSPEQMSFFAFTDSCGRARLLLSEPEQWFVYGDFDQPRRFDLDPDGADADGVIRVTKKQPYTARITGDDWPRAGNIRWEQDANNIVMRGFRFEQPEAAAVVLRLAFRGDACTVVGGSRGVPFSIRADELPTPPPDPLLDLVALDRSLRERARLEPRSTTGKRLRRFFVCPPWQQEGVIDADEILQFAKLRTGEWTLLARDDAPLEVLATASGHEPLPFTVPARTPGAELPRVPLELKPR